MPKAAVPELGAACEDGPRAARASSYSFAYSAAGVFHEKSFAIPFNWMRFQILSSM
jgi:hypothetical protein